METIFESPSRNWFGWLQSMLSSSSSASLIPQRHTKIYIVIDRSGSMIPRRRDVIDGYNQFLQKQKELQVPDETCDVSTYFFSDFVDTIKEDCDLCTITDLTITSYVPSGLTALLDATAHVYRRILKESDTRVVRRIVVILTDGQENASIETTTEQLEQLRNRVATKAEIIYMGSNQDAITNGAEVGATRGSSMGYDDDHLLDAMDSLGNAVARARSDPTRHDTIHFTNVERSRSMGSNVSASTLVVMD